MIFNSKQFYFFTDTAKPRTDGTVAKGVVMLFVIFNLFIFVLLHILDVFKTFVCFLIQERKEFEDKYSKEQGAMREQLQVSQPAESNFMYNI